MKWIKIIIQLLLAAGILLGGRAAGQKIMKSRKKPAKVKRVAPIPVVTAQTFKQSSYRFDVTGSGTISPEEQVSIVPQVAGNIKYISKNLVDGGFVKRGEILFKIDPSEYYLRLESAKTTVAIQKTQLQIEQEEGKIARQEWRSYQKQNPNRKPGPLTLREPQRKLAESNLKAARVQEKLANLNVRRTVIRAPFNALVQKKNVSTGQYVAPGTSLTTLIGIDHLKLTLPIRQEDALWIKIPAKGEEQPEVVIKGLSRGEQHQWRGKLRGTESTIDPSTRMINLLIMIDQPYQNRKHPLTIGTYVSGTIAGKKIENIHKIPRELIQKNDLIYTVKDDRLQLKKVSVLRYQNGFAYINHGLPETVQIITSRLDTPVKGMKLKVERKVSSRVEAK